MQYLVGLEGYCSTAPFDPSMMVHFRKRLGEEALRECSELIVKHGCLNSASPRFDLKSSNLLSLTPAC